MWCIAESLMTTIFSDKAVTFWVIGGTVAIVAIVAGTIHSALNTRAREQTKREIAAYLAEGSIDKDTALAMMNAAAGDDDSEEA